MHKLLVASISLLIVTGCKTTAPLNGYALDKEGQRILFGEGQGFLNQRVISRELHNVDFDSFAVIDKHGYAKDKALVYHYGRSIPFADPATFRKLSEDYAIDKKHVFHRAKIVKGADPADAYVIDDEDDLLDTDYLASGGRVFINNVDAFVPCDIDSFKVLSKNRFAKDKHCVYFMGQKLQDASPNTFKTKSSYHSLDHRNVYYEDKKIAGANVKKFREINLDYATDGQHVFYQGGRIDASPIGFRGLSGGYAKNKESVFYEGRPLPGSDPTSFSRSFMSSFARDDNQCYYNGELADCETKKPFGNRGSARRSMLDGVDFESMATSRQGQDEAVSKIVSNMLEMDQAVKGRLEEQLPELIETLKESLDHRFLTPDKVAQIDLSQLPVGHSFYLWKGAAIANYVQYELRTVENGIATFVLHTPNTRGAMFEQRTVNGQVLLDSESLFKSALSYRYSPHQCLYTLGTCAHTRQSLALSGDPVVSSYETHYDNGVWVRKGAGNVEEHFLFDEFGLPVLSATKRDGKLTELWYRRAN
ncbi:DKNYY domain-containing protein [Pseudoalteromonas rubra]|uniref:DKNYY family protein n=1 Tax=Pseudoalteromonas rubra TaxID=43658 RepID=A0A5S3WYZ8_9GAMM|nr:DKNYY domain-containing protein [Pseudoalteromonas rubra]TMP36596.1 hypothetical protein CWB98_13270 [Pseudoalteromonas rubra]